MKTLVTGRHTIGSYILHHDPCYGISNGFMVAILITNIGMALINVNSLPMVYDIGGDARIGL
ncbi:MAG: hypothetical protein IBX69_07500 [Anaerolineales bacterium]|nr:hypothetical protein [Anaerolineales bacterium]